MSVNLPNLFASKFIARTDAKAKQSTNGEWYVHTSDGKREGARLPWSRPALEAHVEGRETYGHYLLNQESQCKLFAFDIDLEKSGTLPAVPLPPAIGETEEEILAAFAQWDASFYEEPDLRGAWLNRAHPGRGFIKFQLKHIAHMLARAVRTELDLPCAVAYSGGKGVHVYGFTGLINAAEAREGAQIVLDTLGCFVPKKGEHFFKHGNEDVLEGFPNISVEVFPKQGSLDGKDLGNLMGLPLGKNLKAPSEPKFFVDMTTPLAVLQPVDAGVALTTDNPFSY